MEEQIAEYFFAEASKAFAFVVSEYAFAAPQLQVDGKIGFVFVTFIGNSLAIECILDGREADVDCKISRVVDGMKSTDYAVNEAGLRMREGLACLFRRRGVRDRLFGRVDELELRERIKVTLADFASMLKKHGQEILADSPSVLA